MGVAEPSVRMFNQIAMARYNVHNSGVLLKV